MIDQTLPAYAQAAIRYWWLFALHGLVAAVIGALLIFKPDRTVSFVAVLLGPVGVVPDDDVAGVQLADGTDVAPLDRVEQVRCHGERVRVLGHSGH